MAVQGMNLAEVKAVQNELECSPSKSQASSPIGGNKHVGGKSGGKKAKAKKY